MSSSAKKQITGGIIFLVISILYGWEAGRISLFYTREGQIFTAQTVPYTLSLLGIVFSVLYILIPVAKMMLESRQKKPDKMQSFSSAEKGSSHWLPVILLLLLMTVYVALFSFLGFILSTIGFLAGGFYILGIRSWKHLVLVSVGVVIIFWLLVGVLLDIYLIEGTIWNIFR